MVWIKAALFSLIVLVLNTIIKVILRKLFKIEKERKFFFSYNHINELHRKIDWAVRLTSMIVSIVIMTLVIIEDHSVNLMLITWIFLIVLDYTVSVFFEWNYSQNPKQSILTISEGSLFIIVLVIVLEFDLLLSLS
ncbi:DUF4181 domain-containing protein [Jeotgalibacillus sp. S-D1]|uniref:DUF4181 domain-containing protein n=1 Tax=Jeotgalibacillus sp. S-D1 TaxID=2552189 RepID=UPI0010596B5F|nr:DUF4181 domain-containing protein [Jeotgalibacillus sp. S-D1]TDL32804.1 DUF4181 domain-containing protein [Jeotgalibacillus sp. S-D1]